MLIFFVERKGCRYIIGGDGSGAAGGGFIALRIKGTFLKDYVKIVNATRDKDWERFLTEDDWKIIGSMILPTQWYPAETMGRISEGIFELLTGRSLPFIREFGRSSAPRFFDDVKQFLLKDDIPTALNAWRLIADRYVDEMRVMIDEIGPHHAHVSYYPVDGAPSFEHYREVQAGNLEWLVSVNGGKNPASEFHEEAREGRTACIIRVTWE